MEQTTGSVFLDMSMCALTHDIVHEVAPVCNAGNNLKSNTKVNSEEYKLWLDSLPCFAECIRGDIYKHKLDCYYKTKGISGLCQCSKGMGVSDKVPALVRK